jgi:hypothetical protein
MDGMVMDSEEMDVVSGVKREEDELVPDMRWR